MCIELVMSCCFLFHRRDTFVVCTVNTFTSFYSSIVIFSILGFMAHEKGVEIQDVVKSGPGLAFLVFPEVVLQLTPSAFWEDTLQCCFF